MFHGIPHYEVVGYASEDGEVFCEDHGDPKTMEPIFAGSEWDYYPTCDHCRYEITEVGLTSDGMYEQERRKFFNLLHDARAKRRAENA